MNLFFGQRDDQPPTGLRKWAGAVLRLLGPSWRAAPVRRISQAVSLLVFLVLFVHVARSLGPDSPANSVARAQWLPAETFLWLDPLVGISASLAARAWTAALGVGLVVLGICLFLPRGFCGYVCPLGTLADVVDWLLARADRLRGTRFRWLRLERRGWWSHLRFALLVAALVAAALGVGLAGYVAAVPVLTRGLSGSWLRGYTGGGWGRPFWENVAAVGTIMPLAIALAVCLLGRRFWCRALCPTGALLSVFSLLRLWERKVSDSCISCGRCRQACAFDAIGNDFATRPLDCTFCQECGGVCPVGAIEFAARWKASAEQAEEETAPGDPALSRRALVAGAVVGAAATVGIRWGSPRSKELLRPPGALDEDRFLALCVRCGMCMQVCPGPVLHPMGLAAGLDALWTPVAVPVIAGCHQDCNACTQVCPTGAIQPLALAEKRRTAMGLAAVNTRTCLPHAGERDCRLCFEACKDAGYHAIRMREIPLEVGDVPPGAVSDDELEAMGRIEAPFVHRDACTGCGQCENRCHQAWVRREKMLQRSAIVVTPEGRGRRTVEGVPGTGVPSAEFRARAT